MVRTSADANHPHAVHLGVGSDFTIPVAARDDFTLSLWVRTTAVGGDSGQWWSGLGLLDADLPGTASDFGLSLTANRASFGAGAADTTVSSTSAINDGAWHLVTATRSAGGQQRILVDGLLQGMVAGPAGARAAPLSITVGASHDGGGVFAGDVDDIRIYGRTLTTAEVQAVVTGTPGGVVGTGGGGGNGGTTGGGATTVTGGNGSGCGQGGGFAVLVLIALSLAGMRRRR